MEPAGNAAGNGDGLFVATAPGKIGGVKFHFFAGPLRIVAGISLKRSTSDHPPDIRILLTLNP
jgi:hypothetical protein